MARQIAAGVYMPLDKAKLHNWKNLDPRILELVAAADPGNAHGVPYLWSVTGHRLQQARWSRRRSATPHH